MPSRSLKSLAVLVALLALAALPGSSAGAQPTPQGSVRVIQYFPKGPSEQCFPDPCGQHTLSLDPVTMPSDHQVDVTVSLSFQYVLDGTKRGRLEVDYQSGDLQGDLTPIYHVGSLGDGHLASTTLTWFAKGILGQGRTYHFDVLAFAEDQRTGTIQTTRVTAVIDVTPAPATAGG